MKLNRTTLRTVDILKLVSKRPDGITLDEICERLGLPKTSAYDIVTTLVQTGMIHVAREQKQSTTSASPPTASASTTPTIWILSASSNRC